MTPFGVTTIQRPSCRLTDSTGPRPGKGAPSYSTMPPARIDEIRAVHAMLRPRIEELYQAIERLD